MKIFNILLTLVTLVVLPAVFYMAYTLESTKPLPKPIYEPTPTIQKSLSAERLFDLVQEWRVNNKLQPYIKSDKLCDFAKIRIYEIKTSFNHDGFLEHKHLLDYQGLAENLARNFSTEYETLLAWIESPSHLKDLKADYAYSCLLTDGTYAVQIFANF